jgi:hypothetical protein
MLIAGTGFESVTFAQRASALDLLDNAGRAIGNELRRRQAWPAVERGGTGTLGRGYS